MAGPIYSRRSLEIRPERSVRGADRDDVAITKEMSMRVIGNRLWLVAVLVAVLGLPGVAAAAATITGTITFTGKAARSQAARHGRRPCVRQEAPGTRPGRDAGPRQRQYHGEHHGLGLEGAPGREDVSRSQDSGHSRSERLHVRAARDGDHGRPGLQDPQLRRHPPQHPHASQDQPGIQPRRCRRRSRK